MSTRRRFGRWTLTTLVVGNMIGAGVFTTSGFALQSLQTPGRVLLAWLVGGVLAVCGALSYGALARRLTESGGEYLYLSRALHPAAGFVAGWISILAGFTGAIAFAATAFEAYLLPAAARPQWLPEDSLAIAIVVLAALAHGKGVRAGALVHNFFVVGKLLLIGLFVGVAFSTTPITSWQWQALTPAPSFSVTSFAQAVMWISLSYSGFNAAVYIAGEARDAKRDVPVALLHGTLLVTVVYLALNTAFVCLVPAAEVAGHEAVAARAAMLLGGEWLAGLVRVVIAFALATSVSAMMMAGPRVYARMAEDGLLPASVTAGADGPTVAMALQGALAVAVILVSGLQNLLSFLGFTLSLSAALTVASLFMLRHREGARAVPCRGYPWIPLLFISGTCLSAFLAALREPLEPLVGLCAIALGLFASLAFSGRATGARGP